MSSGTKRLISVLGLLGDLDSFEYVQILKKNLEKLRTNNINLLIIGIGDELSSKQFSNYTGFPDEFIKLVNDSSLHKELGCCSGLELDIEPFLNLILMCIGIKSPGTLREVIRGYTGDKKSLEIFDHDEEILKSLLPNIKGAIFDKAGGTGFLRPFEMATLRLGNMIEVINNWDIYMHNKHCLTQRGGTFLLDEDSKLLFSFRAQGLLGYSENMSRPIDFLERFSVT